MRRMWRRQLMAFSRPATPSRLPKTKATVQGGGIWRGYSVDCGPAVQFSIMEIIGAPYGNRTRVSAVKGLKLGHRRISANRRGADSQGLFDPTAPPLYGVVRP